MFLYEREGDNHLSEDQERSTYKCVYLDTHVSLYVTDYSMYGMSLRVSGHTVPVLRSRIRI